MRELAKGTYFGEQKKIIQYDNLVITDTEYTHDFVDWHYHENAYFTFLLKGRLAETNKKESCQLVPGSLLFHQWQDPHYNVKEPGYTRGFHIEISKAWFETHGVKQEALQGSFQLHEPKIKSLVNQIYLETKILDSASELSILQTIAAMQRNAESIATKAPKWLAIIKQILNDEYLNPLTLDYLAKAVNIHPVHLSREFPKYFGCSLGDYLRTIRIEKSTELLLKRNLSIMSIANTCGFSDQSHFIRLFKVAKGVTPAQYRNLVASVNTIQSS
jgi:AraC family transcriptional regulator